jgi:hypothetical protein
VVLVPEPRPASCLVAFVTVVSGVKADIEESRVASGGRGGVRGFIS